mmetsp:Transcript_12602/g.25579  ORF Transcript_12602/g.25579 Transcript_12602/m.25579 type:complete len:81 (+) Transcript_12602:404-646(+)
MEMCHISKETFRDNRVSRSWLRPQRLCESLPPLANNCVTIPTLMGIGEMNLKFFDILHKECLNGGYPLLRLCRKVMEDAW